jgi:oxygen-independent coproporphyrinogen-3 oxidase
LANLAPNASLSLYVHIPFCREMCTYCGCHVVVTRNQERADAYLDVVERELDRVTQLLGTRRTLTQLHLGGGTPTFLDVAQLERLGALIHERFDLAPDVEAAAEIDPMVTSAEQLACLRKQGFNRLSFGVQDIDPQVQKAVRREQPLEVTRGALDTARQLGFGSLNLDLMYGLPYQTEASFARTIEAVIDLRPDRLSLFGYAHVPWVKPHQRLLSDMPLPGTELRLMLFAESSRRLQRAGYLAIGLDHFALADDDLGRAQKTHTLRRNFQGYTARRVENTIAVGASGISDLNNAYFQNEHRLSAWEEAIEAGALATERGYLLTDDDRFRRHLIDALMCYLEVDLEAVARSHGRDVKTDLSSERRRFLEMARDGLVDMDGTVVRMTNAGRPFLRNVAMVFDRHLPGADSTPRHSSTV